MLFVDIMYITGAAESGTWIPLAISPAVGYLVAELLLASGAERCSLPRMMQSAALGAFAPITGIFGCEFTARTIESNNIGLTLIGCWLFPVLTTLVYLIVLIIMKRFIGDKKTEQR